MRYSYAQLVVEFIYDTSSALTDKSFQFKSGNDEEKFDFRTSNDEVAVLNELGGEGWRVVDVTPYKRERHSGMHSSTRYEAPSRVVYLLEHAA